MCTLINLSVISNKVRIIHLLSHQGGCGLVLIVASGTCKQSRVSYYFDEEVKAKGGQVGSVSEQSCL